METLVLIPPSPGYTDQILAYKTAFEEEHLFGGNCLQETDQLDDWFAHLKRACSEDTVDPGRAPSSTFLCIRESDQKMVGICNIRHHIKQEYLATISGHIGYSILSSERKKGYGTEQLRLALLEAKKLGIDSVLITAAEWNIGSQRTILANGGIYDSSIWDSHDQEMMYRYWIHL